MRKLKAPKLLRAIPHGPQIQFQHDLPSTFKATEEDLDAAFALFATTMEAEATALMPVDNKGRSA